MQGAGQPDVVALERGQLDFPFLGVRTAVLRREVSLSVLQSETDKKSPLGQSHFESFVLVFELLLGMRSGLGGRVVQGSVFDRIDVAGVQADFVRRTVRNGVLLEANKGLVRLFERFRAEHF